MKQIAVLYLLACLAAVATGVASPQERSGVSTYTVGPRDLLKVQVYEDEKLSGDRRVAEDGTISMPLLGDIPVAGKTPAEIASQLKRLLEDKYMQRASVDVQIQEFQSRPISVLGAVQRPGNLAFSGRGTLLEALTAAGGLTESHGRYLYVLRRADNGLSDQIAIDLNELLAQGDPRANIPIFANDLINVPPAVDVTVYCIGEVVRPGVLTFKSSERITLLAAIAHAGGMTDRAGRILVKRANPADGPGEMTVDYKRILAGKAPDVELKAGDVIVVKESFF